MAGWLDRIAARLAFVHARRVFGRFERALRDVAGSQQRALRDVLNTVGGSDFARRHGLDRVRSVDDLRQAAPIATYEDLRATIDRVYAGEVGALFAPGTRVRMFATSSGTTAARKLIPVTDAFVRDYRRGWNTFGLKLLSDHPKAVLRGILQSSGRFDESYSPVGVPCGAITGLLARTQKRIVRRYYVGKPELAYLNDPAARYYALMRLAITRDVAFAVTANPATLIRLAETVHAERETLVRDVRDGTLSVEFPDADVRGSLTAGLRPDAARARELEALAEARDPLRPCDYWKPTFVACWQGGSLGHYLPRLRSWWGELPVRDVGLLASEGRVTIPLEDDTPVGVLDVVGGVFEFIPAEMHEAEQPETLLPHELEAGRDYIVVLSNTSGLVRYRLDDVVRMHGFYYGSPRLEFRHRAGRVASVAGEKLTEQHVVSAFRQVAESLGVTHSEFVVFPEWSDPPVYRAFSTLPDSERLAAALDGVLAEVNEEYGSRRKSLRLGMLRHDVVRPEFFELMDSELIGRRGGASEQYKRPCLLTTPEEAADLFASIAS